MKLDIDIKDPKYKTGDVVLSIYLGVGDISSIVRYHVSLYFISDKGISPNIDWNYVVHNNGVDRSITENNIYLLTQIEEDINKLGVAGTAKKYRIDVSYIELCNSHIQREIAEWEADGRSEALGS